MFPIIVTEPLYPPVRSSVYTVMQVPTCITNMTSMVFVALPFPYILPQIRRSNSCVDLNLVTLPPPAKARSWS